MRIKARLGRDSIIALEEVKKILFADESEKVTNGFVIEKAWYKLSDKKDDIDWVGVSTSKIPAIMENKEDITGIQTTFNIDDDILEKIKEFQYSLAQENQRIYYFPYIIKIILFAVILGSENRLPLK